MKKLSTLVLAASLFVATSAQAQLFRAYVSPSGSDGNPCTLAAPCRLLPAALAAVASGGEIWMLDSANYNNATTVNVTKSVTILAVPGAIGSVVAAGGPAINVNTAGVKVVLRNLVIVPLPSSGATHGIFVTGNVSVAVEQCVIANLPVDGINFLGTGTLRVMDTTIRDNAGSGIVISGGARGTVARATISGHAEYGVHALGGVSSTTTRVNVSDSTFGSSHVAVFAHSVAVDAAIDVAVNNSSFSTGNYGVYAQSDSGAIVTATASNNMMSGQVSMAVGTQGTGARVLVRGNTISRAGTGLNNGPGGLLESGGGNVLRNNTSDTAGTITPITTY